MYELIFDCVCVGFFIVAIINTLQIERLKKKNAPASTEPSKG